MSGLADPPHLRRRLPPRHCPRCGGQSKKGPRAIPSRSLHSLPQARSTRCQLRTGSLCGRGVGELGVSASTSRHGPLVLVLSLHSVQYLWEPARVEGLWVAGLGSTSQQVSKHAPVSQDTAYRATGGSRMVSFATPTPPMLYCLVCSDRTTHCVGGARQAHHWRHCCHSGT